MLRRHHQIRTQVQQLLDALLFGFAFWLAWGFRANPGVMRFFALDRISPFENYLWLYVVIIVAGPLVLESQGFYDRPLIAPRRAGLWALFKGCVIASVGLIIIFFLFRLELPRSISGLFGVISFSLIILKEELVRVSLRSKFARSQLQRRFILVGARDETARMRHDLTEMEEGLVILAELDLNQSSIEDLADLLHEHSVSGVILNGRKNHFEQIERAIRACETEGVEVWLVADFFQTEASRTSFDEFRGKPVLVFRTTPEVSWQGIGKQALDLVLAFIIVLIMVLPFLAIALLIKLTSRGPVLFRQQRCGLNGRPFTIFKFRTMTTDAEQRKHELAQYNEMSGPVFKMTNDPRVTRVGRFLRKTSLDEFPQLFNVLRGEMSLVGPRPLPVDEVKRFDDLAHRRRLSVKPGMTCLWQIRGRNKVSDFNDWVRLDLEYIDNWSLWLDLKILWWTVPVVLVGSGAR